MPPSFSSSVEMMTATHHVDEEEPNHLQAFINERNRLGRWMSYALRYGIYGSGLPVDQQTGWIPVEMLAAWGRSEGRRSFGGRPLVGADIFGMVTADEQGRFALEYRPKEATWYIRATPLNSRQQSYYYGRRSIMSSSLSGGHASSLLPTWLHTVAPPPPPPPSPRTDSEGLEQQHNERSSSHITSSNQEEDWRADEWGYGGPSYYWQPSWWSSTTPPEYNHGSEWRCSWPNETSSPPAVDNQSFANHNSTYLDVSPSENELHPCFQMDYEDC